MVQLLHQSSFLGKKLTDSVVLICIKNISSNKHTHAHTQIVLSTDTRSENIFTVKYQLHDEFVLVCTTVPSLMDHISTNVHSFHK